VRVQYKNSRSTAEAGHSPVKERVLWLRISAENLTAEPGIVRTGKGQNILTTELPAKAGKRIDQIMGHGPDKKRAQRNENGYAGKTLSKQGPAFFGFDCSLDCFPPCPILDRTMPRLRGEPLQEGS